MVVLIPIVIGRIATGDPPTPSEPPSEPAPQESDPESPPNEPPVRPPIAPTVQPLPPPPPYVPPPTCDVGSSFYADVSLWYGITDLHADDGGSGHTDAGVFRNAMGFGTHACHNNVRGVDFRGGLVLDIGSRDLGDTALGAEVAIDWPVSSWRLGFRTSITQGSTTQYWIGGRAQAGALSFGLDIVNSANHVYTNGNVSTEISTHAVLAGFGLTGKPGRYVLAAEAITTAIVVGLVIVACTSGGCFD